MCLITYWKKPEVAKEDIVCYKVLIKENGKLYSPYLNVEYNIGLNIAHGELEIDKVGIKSTADYIYTYNITLYCIGSGVLHCYKSKYRARKFKDFLYNRVVYKCVIPKGSKYYVSINDVEICSDKLILLKEIH